MIDDKPTIEEALAHFGVKGMKWGVRKKRDGGAGGTPKISKKENRQLNREARDKFNQEKLKTLTREAQKDSLIRVHNYDNPYGVVVTGKEFVANMEAGRALDIKLSEVYARKTGTAPDGRTNYELNRERIGSYKKQNFRKNPPPAKK